MGKERLVTVLKIVKRADFLGLVASDIIALKMDIEKVDENVGLNLEGLYSADDANFAHDIVGIQNNINRSTGKLENHFLPRYASKG